MVSLAIMSLLLFIDDKPVKYQIFLPLGKKELCAAKGSTGDFGDPKGRPCNCVAFRLHIPNSSACVCAWVLGVNNWIISVSLGNILLALKAYARVFLRKYVR